MSNANYSKKFGRACPINCSDLVFAFSDSIVTTL